MALVDGDQARGSGLVGGTVGHPPCHESQGTRRAGPTWEIGWAGKMRQAELRGRGNQEICLRKLRFGSWL